MILVHLITLYLTSFISAVALFPISLLDTYFISTFNLYNVFIIVPIIVVFEVINAYIVYKMAKTLTPKIVRKDKTKEKLKSIGERLKVNGLWIILIVSMTPLPYTLTLLAAGAVEWGDIKKLMIVISIGRGVKYIIIALAAFYGWQIFL